MVDVMVNNILDKVIRRVGRDYEDYYDPQPTRLSDIMGKEYSLPRHAKPPHPHHHQPKS